MDTSWSTPQPSSVPAWLMRGGPGAVDGPGCDPRPRPKPPKKKKSKAKKVKKSKKKMSRKKTSKKKK
ncbi:MAG TPA: hypothetical protein VIE39_00975 [Thermoanaerobaculia bacterium]